MTMILPLAARSVLGAAAAALALKLAWTMDANPSLYLQDKFIVNDERLRRHFDGKTVLVTGGTSGIGAELALRLSRLGVLQNLILTGRSEERLETIAAACRNQHKQHRQCDHATEPKVSILQMDMTAPQDECEAAIDNLEDILKRDGAQLDLVILNAGVGQLQTAITTPAYVTRDIFQVNTLAPISLCQILLERKILAETQGGRHVAVTSSIAAKTGVPLSSSYAASKHALHGFFSSLQAENPWLRIDLICPGPVDTLFHDIHNLDGSRKDNRSSNDFDDNGVAPASSTTSDRNMKMSTARCAGLYLSSLIVGTGGEHWIVEQPTLLGLYIHHLFPSFFQSLLNSVGPKRVQAWKEGKDLYDPQTWKEIMGRSRGEEG